MARKPKALTLRNLPEPVAKAVRERAAGHDVSLNRAVIQLLEEALGPKGKKPRRRDDLDALFGSLTAGEAKSLERSVAEQRRIDHAMWE